MTEKDEDAMTEKLPKAVLGTLVAIAHGKAIVEIDFKGKCGHLDSLNGKKVRDPEFPDRKIGMPGVWTLYDGGYIDQFVTLTEKGWAEIGRLIVIR